MNVSELYSFSVDFTGLIQEAQARYQALQSVLQHNATQPEKRPLETELNELVDYLKTMPLQSYSNEQISLLEIFGVDDLLGAQGAAKVDELIRTSDFDPATANQKISEAASRLSSTHSRINQIKSAFDETQISEVVSLFEERKRSLFRIEFKNRASIENVVDWKSSADEWNRIIHGLALAVGEASEDTLVVGATRGSLILELAASYVFIRLLTGCIKAIIEVAKEIITLEHSIEDLRLKKLLTDNTEASLKRDTVEIKERGVDQIVKYAKKLIGKKLNGDQENGLKMSIEKILEFYKKGGDIDFVAPKIDESADENETGLKPEVLAELRDTIEEVRSEKDAISALLEPPASGDKS